MYAQPADQHSLVSPNPTSNCNSEGQVKQLKLSRDTTAVYIHTVRLEFFTNFDN